jgi:hypothetical protein
MVSGCVWCPLASKDNIVSEIRSLKDRYDTHGEIKWKSVSRSRLGFYLKIVEFFFNRPDLRFRCLVIDKEKLHHERFNLGDHDVFFYKVYYLLLKKIIDPTNQYFVYFDYKDTNNQRRINALYKVVQNTFKDQEGKILKRCQSLHSKDSLLIQLADLLIGAVGYHYNDFNTSDTKNSICDRMSGYVARPNLKFSSPYAEQKFDIFRMELKSSENETA